MDEASTTRLSLRELAVAPVSAATLADLETYASMLLADAEQVVFMRACQRAASHFEGLRVRSVAALSASVSESDTLESAGLAAEVAVALRLSIGAADHEIHRARRLSGQLAATLDATIAGDLTYRHATAMVSATHHIDNPDTLTEVQTRVLARAATKSPGELSSHALRVVAAVDPAGFEARHQALRRTADVTLDPTPDAMAYLTAYLPLIEGAAVQTAIENHARAAKAAGDSRSLGELRVAALVDHICNPTSGVPANARSHGRPVEIHVTATPAVLLGLADDPGEIPGVGPIPASIIRAMASEARLRWLTIDGDTGRLLDYGRTTYRAPAPLAAHVNATWVTSAAPGSTIPATRGDLDHLTAYPDGPTDPTNLAPFERRWHNAKTHAGITITRNPSGTLTWTTPLGQTITTEPWDYRLGP
jgi:hypothetical protein